jgi:hypothetical protein
MNQFEPSPKSKEIDDLLTLITGKSRGDTIRSMGCMTCEEGLRCQVCDAPYGQHHSLEDWSRYTAYALQAESPLEQPDYHDFQPFRDQLSAKEYTISGMCQACQDQVFG